MATIYRSGISRGLVTVIALVLLPVYALMIYLSVWIGLALLVILTALIVDTLVNTRYTIDHKTLRVQSGLFDKRQFAHPLAPATTGLHRPPAAHQSPHHRQATAIDIGQTSIEAKVTPLPTHQSAKGKDKNAAQQKTEINLFVLRSPCSIFDLLNTAPQVEEKSPYML